MTASLLCHHMERSYGIVMSHTRGLDVFRWGLETYMVYFPRVLKLVACPVDRCSERAQNPGRLREHFMYRNWKAEVAILQEAPAPLLWCGHWGMHTLAAQLEMTSICDKSTEMILRKRDVDM